MPALSQRSRALSLGVWMIAVSAAAAVVICCNPGSDPDEGALIGLAAAFWPFLFYPIACVVCVVFAVIDLRRRRGIPALLGLLLAAAAWPVIFAGYYLSDKPWLSP